MAITDPSPKLEEWVQGEFGADDPLVTWSFDQDEVVQGVDLVQENGPKRLPLKKDIFGALLRTAPADAVLATSSSSIGASLIGEDFDEVDRIIVGHPFNPPALMPLVEAHRPCSSSVERDRQRRHPLGVDTGTGRARPGHAWQGH